MALYRVYKINRGQKSGKIKTVTKEKWLNFIDIRKAVSSQFKSRKGAFLKEKVKNIEENSK